ncbi:MAG: PAS domain-containing protein [Proteobacteria bacterium TMED72]|nr:MAG: PAS domain-containing protein [Proteobacteria bacterium TMED72]
MIQTVFNMQYHASALASARAKQQHSAQDLVRLIDTANAPIIGIDADGMINEWNQTAARLTGYPKYEVLGENLVDHFIAEDSRSSVRRVLENALKGEDTANYEIPLVTRHGEQIHILLNATARRSQDDSIEGVIGIGQDITQRLEQESQLRQRVKLEALGGLTGGIAHDFNNLLTIIMGNLSLIETRTADEKEIIEDALKAAQDGSELVRSLLAFSRRQRLLPQNVDVFPVLNEFQRALTRILGESITLDLSIEPGARTLFVDRPQLETALLNLCINARDALEGNGHIVIQCRSRTLTPNEIEDFQIESSTKRDFISLLISDNGPGVPEDILEKIQEPFFTTKAAGQGSGLGLSSVAGFAKQSGGGMKIRSKEGHGTSVELILPIGGDESAMCESTFLDGKNDNGTTNQERDPRAISVLIVDDEPRIRQVAARWLQREGFKVSEACNAETALEILESINGEIDILFSDIVMPGDLDGQALALEVSRLYPSIKIQLATGYDHVRQSKKELEASPSIPTLAKPYDLNELSATFQRLARDSSRVMAH